MISYHPLGFNRVPKANLKIVGSVQAGFPSPGEELGSTSLHLESLLVKNPISTYFLKVAGTSMQDAGIFDGDIIVVDRSLTAKVHDVVVAEVDRAFTLKRLSKLTSTGATLSPENSDFKDINVDASQDFSIWGVVTSVIHKLR